MVWIGVIIILLTFVAILKKYEVRMVLFASGLLMCCISGQFLLAFDKFTGYLVNSFLVPIIMTAMGYAFVMKMTGCDAHLARFLLKFVSKARFLMIPGGIFITMIVGMALVSPTGAVAAIGPVLINVMLKAGFHPGAIGSVLLLGGWGNFFSVGSGHNALVAEICGKEVSILVAENLVPGLIVLVIMTIACMLLARFMKEDRGYVAQESLEEVDFSKVNYLKALMPVLPIILIMLGIPQVHLLPALSVPQAMLICLIVTMICVRQNPADMVRSFCEGIGVGVRDVVTIIGTATAFTAGMEAIGVTNALIEVMKNSSSIAAIAATFGPLLIGIISGSGDAPTLAFNTSITPYAAEFGMSAQGIGSLAFLTASLGRELSPVSGITVLTAGLVKVSPMELTKRTLGPGILACIVGMIVFLYL